MREIGAGLCNGLFILCDRAYDFSALASERGDGADFGHARNLGRARHLFQWRLRHNTGSLSAHDEIQFIAEDAILVVCGEVDKKTCGAERDRMRREWPQSQYVAIRHFAPIDRAFFAPAEADSATSAIAARPGRRLARRGTF